MFNRLLAVALAVVWSACGPPPPPAYPPPIGHDQPATTAHAGGTPSWANSGKSAGYPEMQWLTAVGRGDTQEPCDSAALAELAKYFRARVEQLSNDWQTHFSRVNKTGKVHIEGMNITQLTTVSTNYVLKGARIVERSGGHCLAALDRLPASRNLIEQIDRLDVEIGAKVSTGDAADTATQRFLAYKGAMAVLQRRDALNAELRLVQYRGTGKAPLHGWRELVAKFTGARAAAKVGLKLKGSKAKAVQTCLAAELGKQQIQLIEGSSDVDLMLHGAIKYQKAGVVDGMQLVQASVSLRVTDVDGGRTLGAMTENVRVGRPELKASVQLAVSRLCMQSVPKLVKKVEAALGR